MGHHECALVVFEVSFAVVMSFRAWDLGHLPHHAGNRRWDETGRDSGNAIAKPLDRVSRDLDVVLVVQLNGDAAESSSH